MKVLNFAVFIYLVQLIASCQGFPIAHAERIKTRSGAASRLHQKKSMRSSVDNKWSLRGRWSESWSDSWSQRFRLRPRAFSVKDSEQTVTEAVVAASPPEKADPNASVETDLPFVGKVTLPKSFWKTVMLGICIVWATNFAIIKEVFASLPDGVLDPSLYVAIRFTIAALIMAPGAIGSFGNRKLVRNGVLASLCVFTGYIGQAIGIMTSTANKCAFFCSLNSIWVALLSGVMTGVFPTRTWIAIVLSVTGAAFIELGDFELPEASDLWLLLQPLGFGTGYIVVQENMKQFPDSANAITAFKLMFLALFTCSWAAYEGHTFADVLPILESPTAVAGILYASVVTTALAIWAQSIAFKNVDATTASIILTSEPIWAAAFASCE